MKKIFLSLIALCITFPGFSQDQKNNYSLVLENASVVNVSTTPVQALQSATINGARFMKVDDFYGSLEKGKSSDLIVLDGNPLGDMAAIDEINMVISNGKAYSRTELNNLLNSIKR